MFTITDVFSPLNVKMKKKKEEKKGSNGRKNCTRKSSENRPKPPTRSLSAYNFFFQMERKRLLRDGILHCVNNSDNADFDLQKQGNKLVKKRNQNKPLVKIIAERWRGLKKRELKKYEKLASNDSKRYQKERLKYVLEDKEWCQKNCIQRTSTRSNSTIQKTPIVKSNFSYSQMKSNSSLDTSSTSHDNVDLCLNFNEAEPEVSSYWNTQGRLRVLSSEMFSWKLKKRGRNDSNSEENNFLRHDFDLGRAYYSSFYVRGEKFFVGDYVLTERNQMYRIIGAFQAMKSFIGAWKKKGVVVDEIQKRGHPYAIMVPLVLNNNSIPRMPIKAQCSNANLCNSPDFLYTPQHNEILLEKRQKYHVDESSIYMLPIWLGDCDFEMKKIHVNIITNPSDQSKVRNFI